MMITATLGLFYEKLRVCLLWLDKNEGGGEEREKMAQLSLQQATKGEEIWAGEKYRKLECTVLTREQVGINWSSVRSLLDMNTKGVSHSL